MEESRVMCECCGGDCHLCNIQPIVPPRPPQREAIMKQPLNEAYSNEVLEAYQRISDSFDDFTQLMRKRIPYEEWPERLKIAGVSEELLGEYEKKSPESQKCADLTQECIDSLEDIIAQGWENCKPSSRPDESFRAMLKVMQGWKKYLDSLKMYGDHKKNIQEIMKSQGCDPLANLSNIVIRKIQDMARAEVMLLQVLENDLFRDLSKHNPYWESEHEIESEKLYDTRCKLSCIKDILWDVFGSLKGEED